MNIFSLMFALFFLSMVICGLIAVIVACIKRKWKIAAGTLMAVVCGVFLICYLFWLGDPFV